MKCWKISACFSRYLILSFVLALSSLAASTFIWSLYLSRAACLSFFSLLSLSFSCLAINTLDGDRGVPVVSIGSASSSVSKDSESFAGSSTSSLPSFSNTSASSLDRGSAVLLFSSTSMATPTMMITRSLALLLVIYRIFSRAHVTEMGRSWYRQKARETRYTMVLTSPTLALGFSTVLGLSQSTLRTPRSVSTIESVLYGSPSLIVFFGFGAK
mmetsp:Transcript_9393/g.26731  ORF Transcript_9393/g.26731 Transcript_9393/m.26731 type:complete len:214 (+) Transcript_9393:2831-3472(+)